MAGLRRHAPSRRPAQCEPALERRCRRAPGPGRRGAAGTGSPIDRRWTTATEADQGLVVFRAGGGAPSASARAGTLDQPTRRRTSEVARCGDCGAGAQQRQRQHPDQAALNGPTALSRGREKDGHAITNGLRNGPIQRRAQCFLTGLSRRLGGRNDKPAELAIAARTYTRRRSSVF